VALISISDARSFLDIPASASVDEAELQDFIDAASAVAEFYVGDIVGGTWTEVHDGGDAAIYTRHTPIKTVTSLTEYVGSITYTLTNQPLGSSVDAWGYTIDDPQAGRIVRRSASGMAWRFVPGSGNVRITYTSGVATIPTNVRLGVEFIVRHLYDSQRGAQPVSPLAGVSDTTSMIPGITYAIPNRAIEMFKATPRMPVIG
jgi:hypothetical protein